MVSYVKFIRGTKDSWNHLQNKDKDTLYFIYENQQSESGVLYLGDKLISGNGILDGINIENLQNGDLLIYDATNNTWSAKPPIQVIPIMTGATAEIAGTSGLVPVPKAGSNNLFLKGDGSWSDPVPTILKKQVADLVALDTEKSARQIAAEESAKVQSFLVPVTNNLNNRITQLESQSLQYVTSQVFLKSVGNLNKLFNIHQEKNTLVDAINILDERLTWQKVV